MMKRLVLILNYLLTALSALAANHYIRAGATGANNGNDWTDAWTDFQTTLTRGDTYYVAAGTYAAYDCDTAVDGTTVITIKKATLADHGTETGWNSSYTNGQAIFSSATSPMTFSTPYWILSGQTGSGTNGHGIKFLVTGTANSVRGCRVMAANITLEQCEITSSNPEGVAIGDKQDGVYTTTSSASNIVVRQCFIWNWKRCGFVIAGTDANDWLIESNYVYRTYSADDGLGNQAHGQAIQIGEAASFRHIIRYNIFRDIHGTAFITPLMNLGTTMGGFRIYGNVFWNSGERNTIQDDLSGTSQSIGDTQDDNCTNIFIFNNTFVNLNQRTDSGSIDWENGGASNGATNNIWWNCNVTFIDGPNDYNASDDNLGESNGQILSGNPFVDSANGDFRLSADTTAGYNLGAPYNIDIIGNERSGWSRGAYEFNGSPPVATPRRLRTTTLRVGSLKGR